jgi:diguanylate cyclase (GGDEF)-like protein
VATLQRELASRPSARSALRYAEDLIQTLHEPLVVLDDDLTVRLVNRSFYDTFRHTPSQTLGLRLFELSGGRWAVPRLQQLLEDMLQDDTTLADYEVRVTFENLGERVLLLNARRIERRDAGATTILLAIQDITLRHRVEVDLTNAAMRDKLTGLYNRRGLQLIASPLLATLRRTQRPVQLLFADVDDLKTINDQHGHAAGDAAIVAAAATLRATFRESDLIARYGGDEFLVFLSEGDAQRARVRLLDAVTALPPMSGGPLRLSAGVVSSESEELSLEALVTLADRAMYEDKRRRARQRARTA